MTAIKTPPPPTQGRRGLTSGTSDCSLATAKARFMDSVSEGIDELMRIGGHSRERATQTLLREISRGETSLKEEEVFHMMKLQGLGLDDAKKALIVSKAVRRTMKEQRASAVQAIDELTSRLKITNLLMSNTKGGTVARVDTHRQKSTGKILLPSPVLGPVVDRPTRKTASAPRKTPKTKNQKAKTEAKGINGKQSPTPKNNRKRSHSGEENDPNVRVRADSVTDEVNAKISQTCDNEIADQNRPSIPPVVGRSKRAHMDPQPSAAQPALKRPRQNGL